MTGRYEPKRSVGSALEVDRRVRKLNMGTRKKKKKRKKEAEYGDRGVSGTLRVDEAAGGACGMVVRVAGECGNHPDMPARRGEEKGRVVARMRTSRE